MTGTRYPLAVPMAAGRETITRLGLTTESKIAQSIEDMRALSDLMTSAHAPTRKGDLRLNVGATDAEFREESIAEMLAFVDTARGFPRVRKVNMHPGVRQCVDPEQTRGRHGDYGLEIDGIRRVADHAAARGLELVIENTNANFDGVPDETPADEIDWSERNQSFGSSPEEWMQIALDVDRPNVGLCLDSSHTCTYAHTFADHEKRREAVMAFVSRPELIRHVHWNDNYLYDTRGRNDSHAVLGKGTLPLDMHRAIKSLDATIVIEHFYSVEDLEEELDFIERL